MKQNLKQSLSEQKVEQQYSVTSVCCLETLKLQINQCSLVRLILVWLACAQNKL